MLELLRCICMQIECHCNDTKISSRSALQAAAGAQQRSAAKGDGTAECLCRASCVAQRCVCGATAAAGHRHHTCRATASAATAVDICTAQCAARQPAVACRACGSDCWLRCACCRAWWGATVRSARAQPRAPLAAAPSGNVHTAASIHSAARCGASAWHGRCAACGPVRGTGSRPRAG